MTTRVRISSKYEMKVWDFINNNDYHPAKWLTVVWESQYTELCGLQFKKKTNTGTKCVYLYTTFVKKKKWNWVRAVNMFKKKQQEHLNWQDIHLLQLQELQQYLPIKWKKEKNPAYCAKINLSHSRPVSASIAPANVALTLYMHEPGLVLSYERTQTVS